MPPHHKPPTSSARKGQHRKAPQRKTSERRRGALGDTPRRDVVKPEEPFSGWRRNDCCADHHREFYFHNGVIIGMVEQFEPGGVAYPNKLGTSLGAYATFETARAAVEARMLDMRPPEEKPPKLKIESWMN